MMKKVYLYQNLDKTRIGVEYNLTSVGEMTIH